MDTIRVLIAEDQTLMRQGLHTILDLEDGFEVVGEARDGTEALEQARLLQPDIILMDVQMPRMNGVQATAAISTELPSTRIILLTTFDVDDYVIDGIKAGARGYLLKETPAEELLRVIQRVHAGESLIQPQIAMRLISDLSQRASATDTATVHEPISERERDVLRLLAEGMTNREIASQLSLAEGTVKNHISLILTKLQATNRTQAAHIAREQGLI